MRDRSSLSVGDIKSVIQNFVDKMKEQLLEGKSVNIEGLGVFMLAARSKGADLAKDITAKSVESVRIFFQANKELMKSWTWSVWMNIWRRTAWSYLPKTRKIRVKVVEKEEVE